MRIIDKKDHIIITDLTIGKKLSTYKVACNTRFVFVEYNFSAHYDPNNILGEVISVYKKKGEIKAKIKLYKNKLKFGKNYKEILFKLIPAIGCQTFEIKNSLNIRAVSLGHSNQDKTILSIGDQYIESIHQLINKKMSKSFEHFQSLTTEELKTHNNKVCNEILNKLYSKYPINRIIFKSKISL